MTSKTGFGQQMIVPIMVCLIFVSGFVIYRHNKLIMTNTAMLTDLTKERGENGLNVQIQTVENVVAADTPKLPTVHALPLRTDNDFNGIAITDRAFQWTKQNDVIVFSTPKKIAAYDLTGAQLWAFNLPEELSLSEGFPALSKDSLWATTLDGRIYAFDLKTGTIHWYRNVEEKYLRMPVLSGTNLLMFAELKSGLLWKLQVLDSRTGHEISVGGEFELPFAGPPVVSDDSVYYTTATGHIFAVNATSKKVLWSHEGSPSFRSPPTVVGEKLYAVNEDGIVFQFDRKNSKKTWELELGTLVHSPVAILTPINMAFTVDAQGYLVGMDIKAAKRKWRHNTHQIGADREITFLRVTGKVPTALSREARGHLVAIGCNGERYCLYDPITGYLMYRLPSNGKVMAGLRGSGDEGVFVAAQNSGKGHIIKLVEPKTTASTD